MDGFKSKVPSLQRAISIMTFIGDNGKCAGKDIVAHLQAPKSSVYLLLEEMRRFRMLSQEADGRYSLGIRLIELGEQAGQQQDIRSIARPHLAELSQQTGLLGHLGIIDGDEAFYILKVESPGAIRVHSREGKMLSLYRSGLGKCLLAFTYDDIREDIIEQLTFERRTPTTIDSAEKLREELARIRLQGWAFDNQEDYPEVCCVAAPVFSSNRRLAAAISAVGTTLQIKESNLESLASRVRNTAQAISREL